MPPERASTTSAALAELSGELRKVARPGRAAAEKAYLKSDLELWGVMVPDVRRIAPGPSELLAIEDRQDRCDQQEHDLVDWPGDRQ